MGDKRALSARSTAGIKGCGHLARLQLFHPSLRPEAPRCQAVEFSPQTTRKTGRASLTSTPHRPCKTPPIVLHLQSAVPAGTPDSARARRWRLRSGGVSPEPRLLVPSPSLPLTRAPPARDLKAGRGLRAAREFCPNPARLSCRRCRGLLRLSLWQVAAAAAKIKDATTAAAAEPGSGRRSRTPRSPAPEPRTVKPPRLPFWPPVCALLWPAGQQGRLGPFPGRPRPGLPGSGWVADRGLRERFPLMGTPTPTPGPPLLRLVRAALEARPPARWRAEGPAPQRLAEHPRGPSGRSLTFFLKPSFANERPSLGRVRAGARPSVCGEPRPRCPRCRLTFEGWRLGRCLSSRLSLWVGVAHHSVNLSADLPCYN
jgi:hypothetical protein